MLIRPTRIAGSELAPSNRLVRFQAIHVGVRAGRRPAEHMAMLIWCPDAARHGKCERCRVMPAAGAYARPLALRSRKAAAAIHRVDFRHRVLVVRARVALLAVQWMSPNPARSRRESARVRDAAAFPAAASAAAAGIRRRRYHLFVDGLSRRGICSDLAR
jgi:hypothetical protein